MNELNCQKLTVRTKFLIGAALAGQIMQMAVLPALADAEVRIGQSSAFAVPAGTANMTSDQRARAMQKNVDNALVAASDKTPSTVAVTNVNGQPVVTLGGFYVATVDLASAKKSGTTPSVLAQRWASGLRRSLSNRSAVTSYVEGLTGRNTAQVGTTTTASGSYPYYRQGRVIYIPAGMMMPVSLSTALNSETAKSGDSIQATLAEPLNLGETQVPANSVLIGQITDAIAGRRLSHSGHLAMKFTKLRTPDGVETPITAHIVGSVGKYAQDGRGETGDFRGETTAHKFEIAALHGAIGAGSGALLGTVVGAIASHGYGTGRGAVTGLVIGGALGVAESALLRKGSDVKITSGQTFNLLLDAPASIASNG